MRITIISPGKATPQELRTAVGEYEQRLSAHLPIEWYVPPASTLEQEGAAIIKRIKTTDYVVLLDERGTAITSPELATLLDAQPTSGTKRLVFIIGGAFGVSSEVRERANKKIQLSSLVFPHLLVRLILVEQLYRAWSIRSGGKYHHE